MKKTLIPILALMLFFSITESSFARPSAKLIVNNNTEATLQVWSRYYIEELHASTRSSDVFTIPPGKRMEIDGILPIGLVTVYIGAQYADPSVEKISKSFQINNPGHGKQPRPRELIISPSDFNTDELIDYHSRNKPKGCDPTMGGKYSKQLKKLNIPGDKKDYGECNDWGKWSGSEYKGHTNLPEGYWTYAYPNWYIYQEMK